MSRTQTMYVCICRYCGRKWDHEGRSRSALSPRQGKSNAMGFIVAAAKQHEATCARRSPAERREENKRAEVRWASNPPRSRIRNDPGHPGLVD